jgi:hypothetical protein
VQVLVHNACDPGSAKNYSSHDSRNAAFRAAKRDAGIPMSQQPISVSPSIDKYSGLNVGRVFDFGNSIVISEHGAGHVLGGIGPHFNSSLSKVHYLFP